MAQPLALVIARPQELDAWEPALRAQGLGVIRAERRKGAPVSRESPSVVLVSERLPFAGALRATRELRKSPGTRELPVVLVGIQPFTTAQRLRLGVSAPDATVPRGATPEQIAEAAVEASRRGKLPPVELTPAQKQGMKYSRIGTLLMMFGVIFSFPSFGSHTASSGEKAWFILLIPLGGLVSDVATGRVDGRRQVLSWQGWAALALMVGIALGLLFWPGFFEWANR
jgi:hypothetical protein